MELGRLVLLDHVDSRQLAGFFLIWIARWFGGNVEITFYKRRCQDKCLPATAKHEVLAVQPPVMERDSASFPFPQIHIAFVTTPISSQRRQADGLCKANHSSI